MYSSRRREGSTDESSQSSSRSNRTLRSTNASTSSHQLARSESSDSDHHGTSKFRGNSPQPGPSRLMHKNADDSLNHTSKRKIPNIGELNLSESEEDEDGTSGIVTNDMDTNNEMDESYVSEQEESLIGPNSFTFNADTPLHTFGKTITEGIRERGKASKSQSKKFLFTPAEMPKTKAELRRAYSHLMEKCQGYEDNDADINLKELLSENITKGAQLFDVIGGGPGDMYMAFLHTKICSGMLKHTVDKIGNSSSVFKKDLFIEAVKNWSVQGSDVQTYSPKNAITAISVVASECCVAMPHMVAMVGACWRDRIEAPPKQKKPRAPPRRKIFDTNSALATQHEELNTGVGQRAEPKKTRAEVVSQEISKILKKRYVETKRPSPFLDFTMSKASLADTVEHIFYVGFLIRDGFASLALQRRVKNRRSIANLVIMPTEPPQKKSGPRENTNQSDDGARNQYILSFSPKMWKALVRSSHGEDTLNVCKPPTKTK